MSALIWMMLLGQVCSEGRVVGPETAGQCCWPGQVWSNSRGRCVGLPSCPEGTTASGESCAQACSGGKTTGPDTAGHCCWPAQVWSSAQTRCVGVPECGPGLRAAGESCVAELEAPPAPVAPRAPLRAEVEPAVSPPPSPPPVAAQEKAPDPDANRRGVVNFVGNYSIDPSASAQGGGLGFQINALRGQTLDLGFGASVNVSFCYLVGCRTIIGYIPLYASLGLRLGRVVSLTTRGGLAPSIVANSPNSGFILKALIGGGLFFATPGLGKDWRGGIFLNYDVFAIGGTAHVITVGTML